MPKGNAKINITDNVPPPQTRSRRSRKKEMLSGVSELTADVQTTLCLKDTEHDTGSVAVPIQNPRKECAVIVEQHHQSAEPVLPEQDGLTKEKGTEMRNINVTNVAVTGQEEMDASGNSQLDTCGVNTETVTKTNRENRGETASEQCDTSLNQNCTDHFQVSKDHDESTALEKQIYAKGNANLQENQDTIQGKPSTCTSDVKESTAGSPAKKKRRMSTLGLTEKDQSDFLQTQMCEKWQDEMDSAGKHICDKTAKSVALEEKILSASSSPQHVSADFVTERRETEPMSSNYQDGTEVQIAAASSNGTSILSEPGFADRKTCEAESISPPGPEPPDNPEEEAHLEDQQLQEHKETPGEEKAEKSEKQPKTGDRKSAEVKLSSAGTSPLEESNNKDATEADENRTEDEKTHMYSMTDDGVEKAVSSADTQTEGVSCGVITLCQTSLTPTVQEVKCNCDPEDNPAPGSSAEHIQTRAPDDTSAFRCLDYVSDSQLNTIVLTDEKIMEKDEPDLSACLEDATDLICGLIGELSSLNRKIMVAHRQMENLRRKNPKSFVR